MRNFSDLLQTVGKFEHDYTQKLNNPFFRAASESAMRAVNHPECKKLQVPKKKYETWKEIILDFDPSQSLN